MPFDDPILGGNILIRDAIRSPNYVTGQSGWTINADGSAEFANILLTVSGENAVQIIRQSDGQLVGSIDSDGNASFESLTVNSSDLYVNGETLDTILARYPRGVVAWGTLAAGPDSGTTERAALELGFTADPTRLYRILIQAPMSSNVNSDNFVIRIRDGGSSAPSTASPLITTRNLPGGLSLFYGVHAAPGFHVGTFTAGVHRLLITYASAPGNTATIYPDTQVIIEDIGPAIPQTGISRLAGSGGGSTVQIYEATLNAFWSGTYAPGGGYLSQYGNECLQGQSPSGAGNLRSMIGWFPGTIGAYLQPGAVVLECKATMYFNHWYYNAGGTAVIGTHNAGGSRPGSFSGTVNRVQSGGWPKPGLRTVDLGTTIGQQFVTGAVTGLTLGPGPSTSFNYYGRCNGVGMSSAPTLYFKYQL